MSKTSAGKLKLEVIAYSGYIGEESPREFIIGDKRIEVVDIIERWKGEMAGERSVWRCFKVKGSDGLVYTLCYDEESKEWTCEPALL